MMDNVQEKKRKILEIIKRRGPSLPVHIANETELSMLFSSAFLSELLDDKQIEISNLKVGGSPLYYFKDQKSQLENFIKHLDPKEQEAFEKLRERSLLEDEALEPAIRVALRNIKDFAFSFEFNRKLYWRIYSIDENQAIANLKEKSEEHFKSKEIIIEEPQEEKEEIEFVPKIETIIEKREPIQSIIEEIPRKQPIENQIEIVSEKPKPKIKETEKEFVKNIIETLQKEDIELLEESLARKKEYQGRIRINSDLGKIEFFLIAKDKKKVTENDFAVAMQKSQTEKLPILFMSPGELAKRAQAFLDDWRNLLKFKRI